MHNDLNFVAILAMIRVFAQSTTENKTSSVTVTIQQNIKVIVHEAWQKLRDISINISNTFSRDIIRSYIYDSRMRRQYLDTIAIWWRMVIKKTCGTLHIRTPQCEATDPTTNFSKLYHLHRIQTNDEPRDAPYSLSGFLSREHSVPLSTFRLFLSVNAPLQRARNSSTALIL